MRSAWKLRVAGCDWPGLDAGQAAFDDAGQLQRAGDRCVGARANDGAGDPAAGALLAVVEEDVGELRLRRPC